MCVCQCLPSYCMRFLFLDCVVMFWPMGTPLSWTWYFIWVSQWMLGQIAHSAKTCLVIDCSLLLQLTTDCQPGFWKQSKISRHSKDHQRQPENFAFPILRCDISPFLLNTIREIEITSQTLSALTRHVLQTYPSH